MSIIFIGPIAFAGAGIFALSTIKLVDYDSKETISCVVLLENNILFSIKNRNIIKVISSPYEGSNKIYFNETERNFIIDKIRENYPNVQVYSVKTLDDTHTHPAEKDAIKNRRLILEEMRSLGVNF